MINNLNEGLTQLSHHFSLTTLSPSLSLAQLFRSILVPFNLFNWSHSTLNTIPLHAQHRGLQNCNYTSTGDTLALPLSTSCTRQFLSPKVHRNRLTNLFFFLRSHPMWLNEPQCGTNKGKTNPTIKLAHKQKLRVLSNIARKLKTHFWAI